MLDNEEIIMFKSIHGLASDHPCNEIILSVEVSERLTRHVNENDVMIPYVNINVTKASFS